MVTITSPTKAYISSSNLPEIEKFLTYNNTSNQFAYKKLLNMRWLKEKNPIDWKRQCEEVKATIKCCLVFKDQNGTYVRPGSLPYLAENGLISTSEIVSQVQYPIGTPYQWINPLPFDLYPYQNDSIKLLLAEHHGNVTLATGTGKTAILLCIAQQLGLKTIIVTPSANIFNSILEDCKYYFGEKLVGGIGDGWKEFGRPITVAISKSLTMLKEGSKEMADIRSNQVMLVDETHGFAAETLEKVCHGSLENVPYRFFFTGTLSRGDGAQKLLESIVGKTLKTVLTSEAVRGGYIANHEFRIIPIKSENKKYCSDAIVMKREHALYNPSVSHLMAKMANAFWNERQESTLILVSELSQIMDIIKDITVPYAYAHSCTDKKELALLGLEKVKVNEELEKFNTGEAKVLISTSVLNTGANIFGVHHLLMGQFGSSEVIVKQSIGRALRLLHKSKYRDLHKPIEKAVIWDFDITNIPILKRQLGTRVEYYEDSGVPIRWL